MSEQILYGLGELERELSWNRPESSSRVCFDASSNGTAVVRAVDVAAQ